MVLFESKRDVSLQAVADALREFELESTALENGIEVIDPEEPQAPLRIHLAVEPHVVEESREIAEELSDDEAERVGRCDARFELSWELDDTGELINTLAFAQETLEKLTGGVTWDSEDGLLEPL